MLTKKNSEALEHFSEKLEVERMAARTGSMEQAIRLLAAEKNKKK